MHADNAAGVSLQDTYAVERDLNVGAAERVGSVVAGIGLAILARRQGGAAEVAGLIAGSLLAYRGLSGRCPLYRALGRNTASRKELGVARMERGASASVAIDRGIRVDERTVIRRSPEAVYAFFRDLHNLPRVMSHVESVEMSNSTLSRWTVRGPAGVRLTWDAEIINDRPNELIAWRSLEGADVRSAGSVHFTGSPGGPSTEVRVQLKYDPPAGALGATVARLLGESPETQLRDDLLRLKIELERDASASAS